MRIPDKTRIVRDVVTGTGAALAVVGVMVAGFGVPTLVVAQGAEPVRIDVTLDEFSFSPEPLRIPAGRPVTLVIRNVGKVPHEFMAGREAEDTDFRHDLFADLHVNIEPVAAAATGHEGHGGEPAEAEHAHAGAGHDEHAAGAGHDEHAAGAEHGTGHDAEHAHDAAQDAPAAGGHAHAEGHAHGTMVEAGAGETFLMTFTLPEDRRGEWATGCFLTGHYAEGMHGVLIVE